MKALNQLDCLQNPPKPGTEKTSCLQLQVPRAHILFPKPGTVFVLGETYQPLASHTHRPLAMR